MLIPKAFTILLLPLFLLIGTSLGDADSTAKRVPKIEQHPNSVTVNVSDPVTLECRASGSPKPRITWFKDNQPLNVIDRNESPLDSALNPAASNKYTLIHDSNLFIFSAALGKGNKSDTGVYHCRAENELGYAISQNANLIITCKLTKRFLFWAFLFLKNILSNKIR